MKRPLVVFSGQGLARADGVNLPRRLKAIESLEPALSGVEWRSRQDLDAMVQACASHGEESLRRMLEELRQVCRKERRSTARKVSHQALFEALAEIAVDRVVVHLTANVDGLTSAVAAGEHGAYWPPLGEPTLLEDVAAGIAARISLGAGLVHLPVNGEAALLVSGSTGALRTFYGSPNSLGDGGPWQPTISLGLARGVEALDGHLELAKFGYGLMRSLLSGMAPFPSTEAAPPADLLVLGYAAGNRPSRMRLPFERTIGEVIRRTEATERSRLDAVILDCPENEATRSWYEGLGFRFHPHERGKLTDVVRRVLAV